MTCRVLIAGGAVDPALLYGRLLGRLPLAPTALLTMPDGQPAQTGVATHQPGRSSPRTPPPHPLGLAEEAAAVTAAIQGLTGCAKSPAVDLVAFSGGATAALAYLAVRPQRVRRVALIEPSWLGNDPHDELEADYLAGLDRVMDLPDERLGEAFVRHFAPQRDLRTSLPIPPAVLRRETPGMRRVWRRWRAASHSNPELTAFPAPLLVLVGGRSHPRMRAAAAHLAESAPHGCLHLEPAADHFDIVGAVTERLDHFLTGPREDLL